MPTYEYLCKSCEENFDKFQSITAEPIKECPKCGQETVNRVIGAGAGIIFKGSGFYKTDYRSDSYKKSAAKEKGSGPAKSCETGKKGAASGCGCTSC